MSCALDQADSHTKDLLGPAVDAQSNPRATLRIISKLDIELLHPAVRPQVELLKSRLIIRKRRVKYLKKQAELWSSSSSARSSPDSLSHEKALDAADLSP